MKRSMAIGLFPMIVIAACTLSDQTGMPVLASEASLTTESPSSITSTPSSAVVSKPQELQQTSTPQLIESPTPVAPYPTLDAETLVAGQSEYSFHTESGDLINYLLYVPGDYNPAFSWPLLVYLHGYGGLGENLDLLADEPLLQVLDADDESRFIVVSPQLPEGFWPKYFERVDHLISHLIRQLPLDESRIYLTGFSIGGVGAWRFPMSYPSRFAAVAPVAGAPSPTGNILPDEVCVLKDLPIWVFHSDADQVFIAQADIEAVAALEACGGNVRFSRYSASNHQESALEAYSDSNLYSWLLEQSGQ